MDLGLKDKVALVLGAGGGLGGAIACSLAGEGVKVAVADISEEAVAAMVGAIEAAGGRAIGVPWDLADLAGIGERLETIRSTIGEISILVNNTGGPPPTPAFGQDPELWRKHFETMVLSVVSITDAVLPGMKAAGWGRIITSTSSGVVAPIPNLAVSNALRLSLVGWSKTLAGEVGREGITVNIVLPGRIATKRITFLDEQRAQREGRPVEEVSAASVASIPVGRYGDPREYGDVVTFLASTRASYLTGSVIRIDGGMIQSI
ncbi:SDR family oxidoreductase [Microvirga zambiensis]|uniref:SDR family oxidoreductase n=1 Tax=Microvirga zambiensis TaxID=1402137 RepID=UPI00191E8A5F|nr:SDR family oxidoreductase [Microvirga zambiensis]